MRLIDADKMLKRIESWNTSDSMDKALYNFTLNRIIEQPTVDAIPVSFIKEQIDKLQEIADYEFIESGGYLGECNHELRTLQDLLKHWAERKEE